MTGWWVMPVSPFFLTHVIWAGNIYAALVICFYALFDGSISFFWHCSLTTFLCYLLYCMPNLVFSTLESNWIHRGIFNVHSKLFRWVSPIPACRHPRTALELTSWVRGPLWPLLCSLEVFTTFSAPHTAQVTENTEANPHFFSAVMFHNDKLAENKVDVLILGKIWYFLLAACPLL